MPSASGVYSLPPGYLAVTGQTIQASQHNPPLEDIAAALTLRLSRDGSAPMTGPVKLASGTVTAPGGVFAADPSSGLYKTTSGIGVAIGGTKVAEFLPGGVVGSRVVGELVPFTGSTVPSALWVFPVGQTLSRTTYAALWVFAQAEIAAGNTFYSNGDGATTFGIGDMRGRVPAGQDDMGGTAANRLTTAGSGVNGAVLGSVGGAQADTILQANLPNVALTTTGTYSYTTPLAYLAGNGVGSAVAGGAVGTILNAGSATCAPITVSGSLVSGSTSLGGSGTPLVNVQPTLVCNYILFAGGPQ